MKHLLTRGLMYGNLVPVNTPVWVERYNRALNHLTGRTTKLTEFHIDISGFSPEVADEVGDPLYLNHDGVNRQFILLSTEQKTAPLLAMKFSTARGILRQFIEANEPQLLSLTARDAVAGELVNSVLTVDKPARLFDIRKITITADTTKGTLSTARILRDRIDMFKTQPNGWWDDALIEEMISLSRETGDVSRYPVSLSSAEFDQQNFWTSHFGGLYVFRDVTHPAAIARMDKTSLGSLPIPYTFDFSDRAQIAKFLMLNGLAEPLAQGQDRSTATILREKMGFILIDAVTASGGVLPESPDFRRLARQFADQLPQEWHGLAALLRWAENDGPWPRITSDHPAFFYTLRASGHQDRDLVNMLLSELAPMDFRQLFICHKEAFYAAYAQWPEAKKAFVAQHLEKDYMSDKPGKRAFLFGPDTLGTGHKPNRSSLDRVGPWGALRR